MYQAIVVGRNKRLQADSLKQLIQKLARERIKINEGDLLKLKSRIDSGRPVEVSAERKLTQTELIKKSMRPPYLGNPYRRVPDTERVSLRVTYIKHGKSRS